MEIQLTIPIEIYTFEEAAKKLGTSQNRRDFVRDHIANGLQVTKIKGRDRISLIELARYIMNNTRPVEVTSKHKQYITK